MATTCDCGNSTIECCKPACQDVTRTDIEAKVCRRCGSPPFIILDKVHLECRECFIESCNKKLRSTIGKTKLLRNNDPVLIGYSGSQSSRALLELIKKSINTTNSNRAQKFAPSIIHIDDEIILEENVSPDDRAKNLGNTLSQLNQLFPDWPIYWTTIEANFFPVSSKNFSKYDPDVPLDETLTHNQEALNKLQLVNSTNDLTTRQHDARLMVESLLIRAGNQINNSLEDSSQHFKFIMCADNATQLSENLLTNVILGYGDKMKSIVNVSYTPLGETLSFLRPLKDFSKKEIAFYLRAIGVELPAKKTLVSLSSRKASIQKVTETFLNKLFVDYPSTYSTLLRTGNKLQ